MDSDHILIVGNELPEAFRGTASVLRRPADLDRAGGGALWIAPSASRLEKILGELLWSPRTDDCLLLLDEARATQLAVFGALFCRVVAREKDVWLIDDHQLATVLGAENPDDYFIGGMALPDRRALLLYRGDLRPLIFPLTDIRATDRGPKLDLRRFEVTDFGQTIRLGDFEISSDSILYELDPAYRRRAKRRAIAQDASFGGALRRLRLLRRLERSDLGVSAKEIARIERGEVGKPRARTLAKIARRLGVAPPDIESY